MITNLTLIKEHILPHTQTRSLAVEKAHTAMGGVDKNGTAGALQLIFDGFRTSVLSHGKEQPRDSVVLMG